MQAYHEFTDMFLTFRTSAHASCTALASSDSGALTDSVDNSNPLTTCSKKGLGDASDGGGGEGVELYGRWVDELVGDRLSGQDGSRHRLRCS